MARGHFFFIFFLAVLLLPACSPKILTAAEKNEFAPASPTAISCPTNPLALSANNLCALTPANPADPDGNAVTYENDQSTCADVVVNPQSGDVNFTAPIKGQRCLIKIRAFDGKYYSPDVSSQEIIGKNNPPLGADLSVDVAYNTDTSITLSGIDLDADHLSFSFDIPTHGTVSGSDQNIIYTPEHNYTGSDSITFYLFDGEEFSTPATVHITVNAPLVLTTARSEITFKNNVTYTPQGGLQPYSMSSSSGSLSNLSGVGLFTPDKLGSSTLTVEDSFGNTAQANVTVDPSLSIGLARTPYRFKRFLTSTTKIANSVYLFGGETVHETNNDLWTYDRNSGASGSWSELHPAGTLPPKRRAQSTIAISQKLYLFGGYNGSYLNDLWVFDPNSGGDGSWTQLNPSGTAPNPRAGHLAAEISGKMYIFGGISSTIPDNLWVFNPSNGAHGSWTRLAPTGSGPSEISYTQAVVIANKIYFYGGWTGALSNKTWVFDPSVGAEGSWTQLNAAGTVPPAIWAHSAVEIAGKMYVIGGEYSGGVKSNDTWIFDPNNGAQGTWSQLSPTGPLPAVRNYESAFALLNKVYMVGGLGNFSSMLSDLWELDTSSGAQGAWLELHPMFSIAASADPNESFDYLVSGGVAPVSISSNHGTLSNASGSGTFTAPASAMSATLTATDALGNTATLVTDIASLSISVANTEIGFHDYTNYIVSGGSGEYDVSCNFGVLGSYTGSGSYNGNGQVGTGTITVVDLITNNTVSVDITVDPPPTVEITVASDHIAYRESTDYTIINGSGDFFVYTVFGYVSNSNGSGSYIGNGQIGNPGFGVDTITVHDNVTGEDVSINITVDPPPTIEILVDSSEIGFSDSTVYTVHNGSGYYTISTFFGTVDNPVGTGSYSGNGNYGTDTITALDQVTGETSEVWVTVDPPPLELTLSQNSVVAGGSLTYTIGGGSGNWNVSASCGNVDNASGDGTFTVYCEPGTAQIYLDDTGTGQSTYAEFTVTDPGAPAISVTDNDLNYGEDTTYEVSGGSGYYQVTTDNGSVDNAQGSGIYFANASGGYANVTVTDPLTNHSDSEQITVHGDITISFANAVIPVEGTTTYTIGSTAAPSVHVDIGNLSNAAGSGTYTAPASAGNAHFTVSDSLGNTGSADLSVSGVGTWTTQNFIGGLISPSAVEISGKIYLYGGSDYKVSDQTWVFDPSVGSGQGSWTHLDPSGSSPGARSGHTAVVINGKMYIFGGYANGSVNSTWVFDPAAGTQGTWTHLSPTGSAPSAIGSHAAVAINNKMYVFGGITSGLVNNTWVFDPASGTDGAWTLLSPSGSLPAARYGHTAVAISGKMYVFGGMGTVHLNDTWVFDPASGAQGAWTQLSPSGSAPGVRRYHEAIVSAGKMYIIGGYNNSAMNDSWVFDPATGAQGTWTQLTPSGTGPSARFGHKGAASAGKIYFFGGTSQQLSISETWMLDPSAGAQGTWSKLQPAGAGPSERKNSIAVTISGKLYAFGGDSYNVYRNDTWSYDPTLNTWTQLSPTGGTPSGRGNNTAVAISNKMYMFGGYSIGAILNDLWVFDPAAGAQGSWTQLNPSGGPPSLRYGSSSVVISDKMYVFGGANFGIGAHYNDLWVFDPAAGAQGSWTQLSPAGTLPSGRDTHSAVVINNKMYVFAGYTATDRVNDLWVYDPSNGAQGTWSELNPAGTVPGNRSEHSAVVISNKMYVIWGAGGDNSIWIFDPSNGSDGTWQMGFTTGDIPDVRMGPKATVISGLMYIFGGEYYSTMDSNVYIYQPPP